MPIDLDQLVDPAHCALVVNECQRGVLGDESALPALADAARRTRLVPAIGALLDAARVAGVSVVHALAASRPDGRGANHNARLFAVTARSPSRLVAGSEAAKMVDGIDVAASDIVLSRLHGLSPMTGTELDPVLRNLGCRTVVVAGVSLNVAITNLVMELVNHAYQCVVPRDAVVGVPPSYGEQVIEHTLSFVATVTDVATIEGSWRRSVR